MRILQIAPLLTPDHAYGGPMTVAFAQCRALQAAGHQVLLAAGARGYADPPRSVDSVPVRLFPATALMPGSTFGGLTAPRLFGWLRRTAASADAVHVHLARDLLTLPAAATCARARVPFVAQTHGMVADSRHPLTGPLDVLLTRRVMRAAARVWYLTPTEHETLARRFPQARLESLRNGIDSTDDTPVPQGQEDPEVLFLARIQARKRPLDFVDAARTLAAQFPSARFRMVGPDEGEGDAVRARIEAAGLGDRLRWDGPMSPAQAAVAMRRASVYVLPSVDEPYPMSVIEALSHGIPAVVTNSCGLAPLLESAGAGVVIEPGVPALTAAVGRLLAERATREELGRRALALAKGPLSMDAVVDQLLRGYQAARVDAGSGIR